MIRNCPGRAEEARRGALTFIRHIVGVSISLEMIVNISVSIINVYGRDHGRHDGDDAHGHALPFRLQDSRAFQLQP